MNNVGLMEFLGNLDYDYKKDEEFVLDVCRLTKCRADPKVYQGYESCYMFLALAEKYKFKKFLEFGTGRGTTSYIFSCDKNVENIVTIDITNIDQQRATWCDYKKCVMSNAQIIARCAQEIKPMFIDIEWMCVDSLTLAASRIPKGPYDVVYIDGSHDYPNVLKDFTNAKEHLAEDAIVVFDDYDPRYGSHRTINELMAYEDCLLVNVNGHIYGPDKEKEECGHVIWTRGKYKEIIKGYNGSENT